jgi:hypothetical protein
MSPMFSGIGVTTMLTAPNMLHIGRKERVAGVRTLRAAAVASADTQLRYVSRLSPRCGSAFC